MRNSVNPATKFIIVIWIQFYFQLKSLRIRYTPFNTTKYCSVSSKPFIIFRWATKIRKACLSCLDIACKETSGNNNFWFPRIWKNHTIATCLKKQTKFEVCRYCQWYGWAQYWFTISKRWWPYINRGKTCQHVKWMHLLHTQRRSLTRSR